LAGLSIRVPHFSQVTLSVDASVTETLYLAPQSHLRVPVSHSMNSVMLGICALVGPDQPRCGYHAQIEPLPELEKADRGALERVPGAGSGLRAVMVPANPGHCTGASADSSRCHLRWTFRGPHALRPCTAGRLQIGSFGYEYSSGSSKKVRAAMGRQISGRAQKHQLETPRPPIAAAGNSQRKTRRVESAGLQSAPGALSSIHRAD
jgi:hypothetical protein